MHFWKVYIGQSISNFLRPKAIRMDLRMILRFELQSLEQ